MNDKQVYKIICYIVHNINHDNLSAVFCLFLQQSILPHYPVTA